MNESILPKVTQEPIIHVDSTPDEGYVLRILKAYRENCNCKWSQDLENPLIKQMNEDCDRRAILLDRAITVIDIHNSIYSNLEEVLKGYLDNISSEKRLEIFSNYCKGCGSTNPRCSCEREE